MDFRITRKAHRKSRTGCQICKQRHVRCDETLPRCLNCIKGNRLCSYKSRNGGDKIETQAIISSHNSSLALADLPVVECETIYLLPDTLGLPRSSSRCIEDIMANPMRFVSTDSLDPYGCSRLWINSQMKDHLRLCEPNLSYYILIN